MLGESPHCRNLYETIAERVAKLEGKYFDIEDDTDPQMTENCLVHNLFLDEISAYRIFSKGKYIVQNLEQIFSRTKISGTKTKADLKEQEVKIEALSKEMIFMSSVGEFKSLDSNFEHLFNRIRMDDELPDDAPSIPSSIPNVISHSRCTTHLKLALQKFSGQIVDWHKFWTVHEGRMEREGYFKDAMQSDEAKDIVRQAVHSHSYIKVIEAVKQELDQPRLIFNHHLTKMLAMKP